MYIEKKISNLQKTYSRMAEKEAKVIEESMGSTEHYDKWKEAVNAHSIYVVFANDLDETLKQCAGMSRYEAFLVRFEINLLKAGEKKKAQLVHGCRDKFKYFENEPNLTDEEMSMFADEIMEAMHELENRSGN